MRRPKLCPDTKSSLSLLQRREVAKTRPPPGRLQVDRCGESASIPHLSLSGKTCTSCLKMDHSTLLLKTLVFHLLVCTHVRTLRRRGSLGRENLSPREGLCPRGHQFCTDRRGTLPPDSLAPRSAWHPGAPDTASLKPQWLQRLSVKREM